MGSSGKVQFTRRAKTEGDQKAEAEKLEKEEARLSRQLKAIKTRKDKLTLEIAVDEAEGGLVGIELGEESQGGNAGATGNEAKDDTPCASVEVKVETEGDGEFPSLPAPGEVLMTSPQKCDKTTPQAGVLGGNRSASGLSKGTLPEGP